MGDTDCRECGCPTDWYARVAELEEAILSIRPTSAGHDCPFCEEWDGRTHAYDCILSSITEPDQ